VKYADRLVLPDKEETVLQGTIDKLLEMEMLGNGKVKKLR
jgi:hypothetical protein